MKIHFYLSFILILSSIVLTAQQGQTQTQDVLGHGFDVRYVDALDWGSSSKGKMLFKGSSSTRIVTASPPESYHFITTPFEYEKELLHTNATNSPFQAIHSNAYYKKNEIDGSEQSLLVYTQKRKPIEKRTLRSSSLKTLDSAMVADFSRLGRDITPEGFIHRYGTHYANQVVYGGVFLKRNLIKNDDFIYSPYSKEEFQQRVIQDIIASHTDIEDPDPYIFSGTSTTYTVGGDKQAQWFTGWKNTVTRNLVPIEVSLQTFSQLFKTVDIPDILDKELKIKMLDSVIAIATQKAQHGIQSPSESNFYKKYSLRFKQTLNSFVKKSKGSESEDGTDYTGDLFFGGFSKDEALLKTAPLIDLGGVRIETLITDEKIYLNKNIEIIVKPVDLEKGYVSVWDDTKKLVKSKERTRLRVSGPEDAKTRFKEALVRNVSKNLEITTIDGDIYEIQYTLELIKEKRILENFVQNYNSAMQTQLIAAATVGDIELLESLFENNANRRIPGLIKTVIVTKQSPEILHLILDNGVTPTIEDLDLLFEQEYYDEHKILILLERGAPLKNNMIYKSVAYKSAKIIYALLREGAQPRNNDLAFALEKYHYPTIKALMSVNFEAFEAGKNELLLAVTHNDDDLAQKFIVLGATADAYILEQTLEQENKDLETLIIPVTEADNETLLVAAKADNTKLFNYFINKNASLDDNTVVEIATDNNNTEILDLALKNGGESTEALLYAIDNENDPAIKIALKNKAVPDAVFSYAAKREDAQLLNDALTIYGGDPSIALLVAIEEEQIGFAKTIIQTKKADIDLTKFLARTVATENLEMTKLLVRNNADPTEGIRAAVRVQSKPITEYLIAQGAETIDPQLIQEAVKKENLELSKILIEKGNSDVNEAIVGASNTGNMEITEYLLDKGASTDKALEAVMKTNNEDVILLLLDKNTDMLRPEFLFSATRKGNLRVVKRLLESGLDPTLGIEDAIRYKQVKTLALLLENGGIPTQKQFKTALEYNFTNAIPLLIKQESISITQPFKNGDYPIHVIVNSVDQNNTNLLDLLVDNGANINAQNKSGDTALHLISTQNAKVIPLLNHILDKGGDPLIQNNNGDYPHDYAVYKKVKSLLKKFKKRS